MDGHSLVVFLVVLGFVGLVCGAVARLLIPGPTPLGLLGTMAAGVAGAFLAGFVGRAIWGPTYTPGWIMSILGATVVVALVSRRRSRVYY